ncbi:MAG: MGMT family protein [Hyphomicrobium sp.]
MSSADPRRAKRTILAALATLPVRHVVTHDVLAAELGLNVRLVQTLLTALTAIERETVPWHRVVARGGAIGWGPNRDQQFARLVREGILVSPAGVVQDMARHALGALPQPGDLQPTGVAGVSNARPMSADVADPGPAAPTSRSRGMKSRP